MKQYVLFLLLLFSSVRAYSHFVVENNQDYAPGQSVIPHSLRDIITQANATTSVIYVTFSPSLAHKTITLKDHLPLLNKGMLSSPFTINGAMAPGVAIECSSKYRGFFSNDGVVHITNLVIKHGAALGGTYKNPSPFFKFLPNSGGGGGAGLGGGVFVRAGTLTLHTVTLSNCQAQGGDGQPASPPSVTIPLSSGGGGSGMHGNANEYITPSPQLLQLGPGGGNGGGGFFKRGGVTSSGSPGFNRGGGGGGGGLSVAGADSTDAPGGTGGVPEGGNGGVSGGSGAVPGVAGSIASKDFGGGGGGGSGGLPSGDGALGGAGKFGGGGGGGGVSGEGVGGKGGSWRFWWWWWSWRWRSF